MFGDGPLLFREYAMGEPLPLATIHAAVLEFLKGKDDAVLSGAQAVNAYVDDARATQDVDILSTNAAGVAEAIRYFLNSRFHIAVRMREVRGGVGFRLFQLQTPKNRHLVDVRPVRALPPAQRIEEVLVPIPAELVASKVIALQRRAGTPKSFTDRRDLALLLLAFPELKTEAGAVGDRLEAAAADAAILATWRALVAEKIQVEDEEEGY